MLAHEVPEFTLAPVTLDEVLGRPGTGLEVGFVEGKGVDTIGEGIDVVDGTTGGTVVGRTSPVLGGFDE